MFSLVLSIQLLIYTLFINSIFNAEKINAFAVQFNIFNFYTSNKVSVHLSMGHCFSNKCMSRSKINAQHLSTADYQGHMFVCLFVYGVYRPSREFFSHIETLPLPVNGLCSAIQQNKKYDL